ncbi:annexin D3 [Coffea arabica]|uniref:Annexin n=1 Tax=Coffea arabica TaxID=13443 RepID=A0A6P6WK68_COFAR|nr:annexin D3-like [Coffea arabica]
MATLRVPDIVPSPAEDCKTLKKAFQGWGTDEKAIIKVLGRRNASQRNNIRETFQQLYKKSLIDELVSELSGDFRKAVILWTYDPPERDARLVNEALKSRKKGIREFQVIVEIACASSPHHLIAVRKAYFSLFDCSLEEHISSNVSLPIQKILVRFISSYRFNKEVVNSSVANSEAATLHDAIKTGQLDHDDLVWILSTRNYFQLRETFKCYKNKYGSSIEQDIMASGKGTLESILKVAIWCIDAPEKHFAEVIRASIIGLGTDEDSLTRAIVTRAEIDMMKVRGEYFNMHKSSLDNAVIGDTSGHYKNFLMTLLGAKI